VCGVEKYSYGIFSLTNYSSYSYLLRESLLMAKEVAIIASPDENPNHLTSSLSEGSDYGMPLLSLRNNSLTPSGFLIPISLLLITQERAC
jgi:hypothetical protein